MSALALLPLTLLAAGKLTLLDPPAAKATLSKDPDAAHAFWASAGEGADLSSINAGDITYSTNDNNGAGVTVDAQRNGQLLFKTPPIPYSGPEAGVGLSPKHRLLALALAREGTVLYDASNGEARAKVGMNWALSPDETWVLSPPEVPFAADTFNRTTVQRITLGKKPVVKDVATLPLKLTADDPVRSIPVAISPDGARYALFDPLGELSVYRASDDTLIGKVKTEKTEAPDLSFSKSGKLVIVHSGTDVFVYRIDAR